MQVLLGYPTEKRLLTAINWLTEKLDKAEIAASDRGRRIGIRRLNRLEYRNTMRDLFGHPFEPTELFSPDTVSDGFDNIGHALVVSPRHVTMTQSMGLELAYCVDGTGRLTGLSLE